MTHTIEGASRVRTYTVDELLAEESRICSLLPYSLDELAQLNHDGELREEQARAYRRLLTIAYLLGADETDAA